MTLHIVLENALQGVDFGLQKGSGSHYETVQTQCGNAQSLHFDCPIRISKDRDVPPDFSGAYVQGIKNERFVYLDIGMAAHQLNTIWSRRLKIPLRDISWKMVDECLTDSNCRLVTHVEGIGKDGGPNCGTVKPFDGWKVVSSAIKNLRLLILAAFFLGATACQNKKTVALSAFYFWQTHLGADNFPSDFVKQQQLKKLYICMLNVQVNAQNQIVPSIQTVVDWSLLPSDVAIVPVVFMPNRIFERVDTAEINRFSVNLARFFKEKMPPFSQNPDDHREVFSRLSEVQLDCDWTEKTRAGYFLFLTQFKKQINVPLSATIRLHQIKYRKKTGIPPVDRGALMVYNFNAPDKFSRINSIFDVEEGSKYLKNAKTYELPLDIALPLFSWGLVFRNRQYQGILNGMNSSECRTLSFLSPPKNSEKKYFAVTADTVFKGLYLRNGDEIEIEEVSERDLFDAADLAAPLINSDTTHLIFYHLNSAILKNYNANVFQKILNRLH